MSADRLAQAGALLAALTADEQRCLACASTVPDRHEEYMEASKRYGDAADALEDWTTEWLQPAVAAEDLAECLEPELPLGAPFGGPRLGERRASP